jgi:DNA-binding MarR family transcriptional regulator
MNDRALSRFRKAYWQAFRGLETLRLQQWERSRITLPQLRVLFTVRRTPGILTTDLAHQLGTTVPTASGIVSKLVTRGLIDRTKADLDRRQAPLQLTSAGAALAGELLTVVDPFLTRVGALVGDDIQAVTATLESVARIAEQVRDELAGAGIAGTSDGQGPSWNEPERAAPRLPLRRSASPANAVTAASTGKDLPSD